MVDIIFIDDNYIYKNFPLPKRLDRGALLSIIQLEQYTSIQDLLGSCLYEKIEKNVKDKTLSTAEEKLFKLVKYSLAMYSANSVISMLRTESARTRNEEQGQDQQSLDAISSAIESKLSYINKRIVNFILENPILKAVATADGCDNDLFEADDVYQGSVYYPSGSSDSSDCNE